MQQPPLKFSPAQVALWHLVESVVATAIITAGTAAYQGFLTNGFNLSVLAAIAFSSFIGALLRGYTTTVRSNLNFGQAFLDGFVQLKGAFDSFADAHSRDHAQVSQAVAQVAASVAQSQQQSAASVAPPPPPPVSAPAPFPATPPGASTLSWTPSASGLPPASFPNSMQVPVPPAPPRG